MRKPRVLSILSLCVFAVVLAACGTDDSPEATMAPTVTREPISALATATADAPAVVAPTAARVERPTVAAATPRVMSGTARATPVLTVSAATPVATPVTSSGSMMPVQATIVLNGADQRDYLTTDEGCVGIGDWSQLQAGAQVIVRDASGAVVDVAELQAGESTDGCSWMADISVPDSEFVSISVPMVAEVWFSQADLESGMVEITLP